MTGFEELQRQLRIAVVARKAAGASRNARLWRRPLIVALAALVVASGVAVAAVQLGGGAGTPLSASRLVANVIGHTLNDPACQVVSSGYRPQVVRRAPRRAVIADWRTIRTGVPSAIPEELASRRMPTPTEFFGQTVRRARSADGTRWILLVARMADPGPPSIRDPNTCMDHRRAKLQSLSATVDPKTAHLARETLDRMNTGSQPTRGRRHERVVGFILGSPGAQSVGPYDSDMRFNVRLVRSESTLTRYVVGVVPDGVRTVELVARRSGQSRHTTRATAVRGNTYSLRLPDGATDLTLTLRAPSGARVAHEQVRISAFGQR